MARDKGRSFAPITPRDQTDPARFGQMVETTKDAFVESLRNFFEHAQVSGERRAEIPVIEKYAVTAAQNDPHTTVVGIFERHPDIFERLPMVVVMSAQGNQRPLTIGPPQVAVVQDPPRIRFALPEPYALADGDRLAIRIYPDGRTECLTVLTFRSARFSTPMSAVTATELANEINSQATEFEADVVEVSGNRFVELSATGSQGGKIPTDIEVHPDTTTNFLTATGIGRRGSITSISTSSSSGVVTLPPNSVTANEVGRMIVIEGVSLPHFNEGRFPITATTVNTGGVDTVTYSNRYARAETPAAATFFIGLNDSTRNPSKPAKKRYAYAFDLDVQIVAITNDEVTRKELSDLINSFLAFFLEDRFFTFMGRSAFKGQSVAGEHYQIVINPPIRHGGENEVARPTDLSDRVYTAAHGINCAVSWYVDREFYYPTTNTSFQGELSTLVSDAGLVMPVVSTAPSYGPQSTVYVSEPVYGPQGPIGPTGPTGPQGPTGPIGPAGTVIYDGGTPFTDFSVGVNINCGGVT